MPKPRKNPMFPKWSDPFFGMSRDYVLRIGEGDFDRGYERILNRAIDDWNARAKENRFLPPTSRERGMEWIPDMAKASAEALRIRKRKIAEIKAREANSNEAP